MGASRPVLKATRDARFASVYTVSVAVRPWNALRASGALDSCELSEVAPMTTRATRSVGIEADGTLFASGKVNCKLVKVT